jgi:hypothetical protein
MMIDIRRILKPIAGLGLVALLMAVAAGHKAKASGEIETQKPSATTHWIETKSSDSAQTPETVVREWPELSQKMARAMIEKYGQPVRFNDDALVWEHNGSWQKSVVYRAAWPHSAAKKDVDYLKQTIGYRVPQEKIEDLRRFDKRLSVNTETNEVSFQSESEKTNFLALNLADEIVTEKRSVEDARDYFKKTARLAESGKSSQYTEGFLFPVPNERVVNPSETTSPVETIPEEMPGMETTPGPKPEHNPAL